MLLRVNLMNNSPIQQNETLDWGKYLGDINEQVTPIRAFLGEY